MPQVGVREKGNCNDAVPPPGPNRTKARTGRRTTDYVDGTRQLPISPRIDTYRRASHGTAGRA
eukprot:2915902-Prymnesium_polylepis.1